MLFTEPDGCSFHGHKRMSYRHTLSRALFVARQGLAPVMHPLNDLILAESDVSATWQTDAGDALVLTASLTGAFMHPTDFYLEHRRYFVGGQESHAVAPMRQTGTATGEGNCVLFNCLCACAARHSLPMPHVCPKEKAVRRTRPFWHDQDYTAPARKRPEYLLSRARFISPTATIRQTSSRSLPNCSTCR